MLGLKGAQFQGVLEVEALAEEDDLEAPEQEVPDATDAAEQAQTLSRPQTAVTESGAQDGGPDDDQQDESKAGKAKGKGKGKGRRAKLPQTQMRLPTLMNSD